MGYVTSEHQERHFRQRNHIPKKGPDSRAGAQSLPRVAGWQRVPLGMLKQAGVHELTNHDHGEEMPPEIPRGQCKESAEDFK